MTGRPVVEVVWGSDPHHLDDVMEGLYTTIRE